MDKLDLSVGKKLFTGLFMNSCDATLSKVAKITFIFWVIKIAATTLGETGGDAVSMSMNLGYAISTAIFFGFFLVLLAIQVSAKYFHRFLYWSVIVATTTAGTTLADYADRSLGIGYVGGSFILFVMLMIVLGAWRFTLGSVSVNNITSPKTEIFYWMTIFFSNTLGTALGDFLADSSGLGYDGSAIVFSVVLFLIAMAYFLTSTSRTLLFWMAFILTRPLGATLGDLLTKPYEHGGFDLNRINSSIVIGIFMTFCIFFTSQSSGRHSKQFS